MPSLLQLYAQEGQMANDLNDSSLQQTGRRAAANIEAKSANKGALWNLAGRGVSAGIGTAKDSAAYDSAKAAGRDTSTLSGVDAEGKFNTGRDLAQNFINPYGNYDNLRRILRGAGTTVIPTHATDGTPVATPDAPAASQPGAINGLDHQNAPLSGYIVSALTGGS